MAIADISFRIEAPENTIVNIIDDILCEQGIHSFNFDYVAPPKHDKPLAPVIDLGKRLDDIASQGEETAEALRKAASKLNHPAGQSFKITDPLPPFGRTLHLNHTGQSNEPAHHDTSGYEWHNRPA